MKKRILILCLILSTVFLFAKPSESVQQLTLENGLTVFLLEDTSTPFIRIEYTAKAGFSSQTQNTSGFFKLYSRIFKESLPQISFETADCYADSSRYIATISPSKVKTTFEQLSKQAFDPSFKDELISSELKKLQKEVQENATSMGTLINAAIDSKVFSDSPWKHDSGLYAPLFAKTSLEKARTTLQTISQRWYTPQNSALFVSGNINSSQITQLILDTFGTYYSSYQVPHSKDADMLNTQKRFVIHDPELSPDMTQIVIQYTGFERMEDCDIAAAILNNNSSFFKFNLLSQDDLNIPGDEYINAQSAAKRDSNRLIIQTLLQPPADKTLAKNTTSVTQSLNLLKQVKTGIQLINPGEFYAFQKQLSFDMTFLDSSSTVFMDKLSSWWAIEQYSTQSESLLDNNEGATIVQSFLNRTERLNQTSLPIIQEQFNAQEPYIFVIISSADFKKNKEAYKNAGFEEITKLNASWYTQKTYDDIKSFTQDDEKTVSFASYENNYYNNNKELIHTNRLLNGIPVIAKHNPNSSQISLLLSIRGGKLNSAQNNGLEEVMVSLLATNIQKLIYEEAVKGNILGIPTLDYEVQLTTSYILLECEQEDFALCCQCISNAMIYSDIIPAAADRAVSNRQYQKRLENGSSSYQLYAGLINQLYPKSDLGSIYNSEKEILEKVSYQQILEEYPKLLDASRYSLIITGNFEAGYTKTLNSTIALLANRNEIIHYSAPGNNFPNNKEIKILVNHTFLTDIPAEKAGPMPAVLIPTTEFLDPVLYAFESPAAGTKNRALFNAMLYYLKDNLDKEIQKNGRLGQAKTTAIPAKSTFNTAVLSVANVPHTKELDAVYKIMIEALQSKLKSSEGNTIAEDIKDAWIFNVLKDANTNSGTTVLLQYGLETFPYEARASLYLEEYNFIQQATAIDFLDILEYFPSKPKVRVYSKEGKK